MSERNRSPGEWQTPPVSPDLQSDDVHIWLLTDATAPVSEAHEHALSQDERERARRLGEAGRARFIRTRAALRTLLSRYTNVPADRIAFDYGPLGKPDFHSGAVHFSVSHAHDRAVLAFSSRRALGIDLEAIRGNRRFDALTARFFSPVNARTLALASPSALPRLFTAAWAQREAYVKAIGGGLYATPDALPFVTDVTDTMPARYITDGRGGEWTIVAVPSGDAFECRLAIPGRITKVEFYAGDSVTTLE